ncbi:viral enhancin domain protein, partial [Yersinia pestis PY-58]
MCIINLLWIKNKLYIISPLVLIHCEFQQEEIKNMHHK